MEIVVSQHQAASSPVSIMHLKGSLDGSNYDYFIAESRKLYESGARNLLLDMSGLIFLSSAGLGALHLVARIFRGEDISNVEGGWVALRAMGREANVIQEHVKLLSPNDSIRNVLDTVGFKSYLEVFTEIPQAIAAFH